MINMRDIIYFSFILLLTLSNNPEFSKERLAYNQYFGNSIYICVAASYVIITIKHH